MKFTFTEEQANNLVDVIDLALKKSGLKALNSSLFLFQKLQNPVEQATGSEEQTTLTYEFEKEEVDAFGQALDIATKEVGLKGASKFVEIAAIFENGQQTEDTSK